MPSVSCTLVSLVHVRLVICYSHIERCLVQSPCITSQSAFVLVNTNRGLLRLSFELISVGNGL